MKNNFLFKNIFFNKKLPANIRIFCLKIGSFLEIFFILKNFHFYKFSKLLFFSACSSTNCNFFWWNFNSNKWRKFKLLFINRNFIKFWKINKKNIFIWRCQNHNIFTSYWRRIKRIKYWTWKSWSCYRNSTI